MPISEEITAVCKELLKAVRQDLAHQLTIENRYALYNALNPSRKNFSLQKSGRGFGTDNNAAQFLTSNTGDFTLYWLALLTVEKVFFRFEETLDFSEAEDKYLENVWEMLQMGKNLILGMTGYEEAHTRYLDEFWYFSHPFVTYDFACLRDAAVLALAVIFYSDTMGLGGWRLNYLLKSYVCTMDFAWEACKAYSLTDKNLPGAVNSDEINIPLEFDPAKSLEFWQWWLTEGISQAHALAQQTWTNLSP